MFINENYTIKYEMETLKKEMEHMDKRLNEMEDKIDSIGETVKEIKDALIGNALTKDRGLVDEFNDVKQQVNEHHEFFKRVKWIVSIAAVVGGIIGFIIELIFNYFINKK